MDALVRVVAHDYIQEEHLDKWKDLVEEFVDLSEKNDYGCILFQVLQDERDPSHFCYVEIWESQEAVSAHIAKPHFQHFKKEREKIWKQPTESHHYTMYCSCGSQN